MLDIEKDGMNRAISSAKNVLEAVLKEILKELEQTPTDNKIPELLKDVLDIYTKNETAQIDEKCRNHSSPNSYWDCRN